MKSNPYSVTNVNVPQGPRVGNKGTPDKREDFIDDKKSRMPSAKQVESAFAKRAGIPTKTNIVNGEVKVKVKPKSK